MEQVTFNDMPKVLQLLYQEVQDLRQEVKNLMDVSNRPRYVSMKEAERITGKTANALRTQISIGNLHSSFKKDGRHYFDREYLEKWLRGDIDNEVEDIDITEHVKIKSLSR